MGVITFCNFGAGSCGGSAVSRSMNFAEYMLVPSKGVCVSSRRYSYGRVKEGSRQTLYRVIFSLFCRCRTCGCTCSVYSRGCRVDGYGSYEGCIGIAP